MKQIQWFPGHMPKTLRELAKEVKLCDAVIEIVDARAPLSSRNPEIQNIIGDKAHIILMNKVLLTDPRETYKWTRIFHGQLKKVLETDAIKDKNMILIKNTVKTEVNRINYIKGTRTLDQTIRAMIVGIPNVGKSTLINNLARKKSCATGNMPGLTRDTVWIKASEDFYLYDTPGVLWPKFESETMAMHLALIGSIDDDILPLDDVCAYGFAFMDKYYPKLFKEYYKLADYDINDLESVYAQIAKSRGCYLKQEIDYERINRLFLKDLRSKKLGGITFDRADDHTQKKVV